MRQKVLPAPGPASTSTGPAGASMASALAWTGGEGHAGKLAPTCDIHWRIVSHSSSRTCASVRPDRLSTWNEWSAPFHLVQRRPRARGRRTCSASGPVRPGRRASPAGTASGSPPGTGEWSASRPASSAHAAETRGTRGPSTPGSASRLASSDVMRPPNDFPPAKSGMPGSSAAATPMAARTVAMATVGVSGRPRRCFHVGELVPQRRDAARAQVPSRRRLRKACRIPAPAPCAMT